MTLTLAGLLSEHPNDAPAIGAPGRNWLSYGGLREQSRSVAEQLNASKAQVYVARSRVMGLLRQTIERTDFDSVVDRSAR